MIRGRGTGAVVLCALALWGCGSSAPTQSLAPSPTPTSAPDCTGVWPTLQHDRQHSARSTLVGPLSSPRALWTLPSAGAVYDSVVVAADCTLYSVGVDRTGQASLLTAVRDGLVLWQAPLDGRVSSSPAVGPGGVVYARGRTTLYSFDSGGREAWRLELGDGVVQSERSSPVVAEDGTIYVGSFNGSMLHAVTPAGQLKWAYPVGSTYSTPALDADGTIYIGGDDGRRDLLYAVRPNGTLLWTLTGDGYLHGAPAIAADGTVYVASLHGTLYAVQPDGRLRWQRDLGGGSWGSVALAADGTSYVFSGYQSGRGVLHAMRPDGSAAWEVDFGPASYNMMGSPTIDRDGTIYVSTANVLHAITADGKNLWTYAGGGSAGPAVIGRTGVLYLGQTLRALQ